MSKLAGTTRVISLHKQIACAVEIALAVFVGGDGVVTSGQGGADIQTSK